jgi:lipopolysaccharide transport system ATP-binding protein
MGDVTKSEGRTILFVSHNMAAIKALCNRGILLEHGSLAIAGKMNEVIDSYFIGKVVETDGKRQNIPLEVKGYFKSWEVGEKKDFSIDSDKKEKFVFEYYAKEKLTNCELGFVIRNSDGSIILGCNSRDYGGDFFTIDKGTHQFTFEITLPVIHGTYEIDIAIVSNNTLIDQWVSDTKIIVKNKFESVLPEIWRGSLNLESRFYYDKLF